MASLSKVQGCPEAGVGGDFADAVLNQWSLCKPSKQKCVSCLVSGLQPRYRHVCSDQIPCSALGMWPPTDAFIVSCNAVSDM